MGPMKPGNRSKDSGANSFRQRLEDEDDDYKASSSEEAF